MGAAANRIQVLAESLMARGIDVTVLCPIPNYPFGELFKDYPPKGPYPEIINGVQTIRLTTFATKSTNPWLRFKAMATFARSVASQLKKEHNYDAVIIQCSPLLVGFRSLKTAKKLGLRAVVNISDLWPLAAIELGAMKKGLAYLWMLKMESYIYKNADLFLGQSEEILKHVRDNGGISKQLLYRNFPSIETYDISSSPDGAVKLIYAGLLGAAQGILELCRNIELPDNWELHIYGEGNEQQAIVNYLDSSSKSIIYMGSLSKEELHKRLPQYHMALAPLKTRIYGSVPSKLFELPHFGLPVLYLGSGEGRNVVSQYKLGWSVNSSDWSALNTLLADLDADRSQWPLPGALKKTATSEFNPDEQLKLLIAYLRQ